MRDGSTNPATRRSKIWLLLALGMVPLFMVSQLMLRILADGNIFTAPQIAYDLLFFALPILEVFIWRFLSQLAARGRWELAPLVVGVGIVIPVGAVMVFARTFLPYLSPPKPIVVILLVVLCSAFASMVLGLLLVFVRLIRNITQFFQNRLHSQVGEKG